MIKHTIFALAIGFSLLFLYLLQYTGAFKPVTLGTDERGPFLLVYKNHSGAYHKIVDDIQQVESWAKENKINCRYTFGEFFDDPGTVEEGRLKSRAGCLIENYDQKTEETIKNLKLPEDIQWTVYEKTKFVIALFSGSPGIGPYKVYPKIENYIKENKYIKKGSILEKYEVLDRHAMNTTYYWPIQ